MKIEEATLDTSVTGVELIPASDATAPKAISVASIGNFVVDKIEAIAAGTTVAAVDGVYLLQSGALKPVALSVVSTFVTDAMFASGAGSPVNAAVLVARSGGANIAFTLESLAAFVKASGVGVSALGSAGALGPSDLALVSQSGTEKKTTLGAIRTFIEANFAAFVAALTEVTTAAGTELVPVSSGGTAKMMSVSTLLAGAGNVTGPATTTENNLPQWDSGTKKLKDGVALTETVAAEPSGTKIPTEAAVRTAITEASGVAAPETHVEDSIPQWGATDALKAGLTVQSAVRATLSAADTAVPTEKAVRDALTAETVAPPLTHTENAIPQWGAANELKAGLTLQTSVRSTGQVDTAVPTEKAVRTAIDAFTSAVDGVQANLDAKKLDDLAAPDDNTDLDATISKHGLMPKTDKAKLDSLVNENTLDEIGAPLSDDDTFVLTDTSETAKKKTILSRVWTYVAAKLAAFKLDDLAAPDDNTDLDATASRHGLLPKLSGVATEFLNGAGAFATPAGNTPFTGDSGTGGAQGLVPAPSAGDAADGKFLKADGLWAEPGVAAGVDITGETAIDAVAAGDELYAYDVSVSAYRKATATQLAAFVNGLARYDTLWIPAGAVVPSNTNGAVAETFSLAANLTTHDVLRFLHTKDTFADFNVVLPDDWDGGAVKVKAYWLPYNSDGAADQHVRFTLAGTMFGDTEALTGAMGTVANLDDQMVAVNQLHVTAAVSLTVAGTAASGKMIHFSMSRDYDFNGGGGTALATGACLLGVLVQYKKSISLTEW